ncbi:MAG: hypothetical protein ABJA60_12780 [Nitrosospira sp.]
MAHSRQDAKPLEATNPSSIPKKKKRASALPDPGLLQYAIKSALPETFKPQLATLVDGSPANPGEWAYEIKFDGYRLLARIDGKKIQLFTRNGNDWSDKLPHLVKAIDEMKLGNGWLDGEVIVPNENGIPDFQSLQNAFDSSRTQSIIYYVFDMTLPRWI